MSIVERAKNIILKPSQTWAEIKNEQVSIGELYLSYAVILAAIPAIAQFIGNALIGYSVMGVTFRIDILTALGYSIVYYVLSLIGLYIMALIANVLAPSFGSEQNLTNAFKAVVFSMTPSWIAGVLYIIPPLSILVILAGIYGIYLFYLGLPLLMNTPKDKALVYFIVVIVLTILVYILLVYILIGVITSAVFVSTFTMRGMM